MAKSNEVLRVGVPVRVVKLAALLSALDASEEATVRHHSGSLIVEEPERTVGDYFDDVPEIDPTLRLDDTHPAGGQS